MSDYNSPTETLKRIKRRLEAGYFMLNDDIEWLLLEFEKQQKQMKNEEISEEIKKKTFKVLSIQSLMRLSSYQKR
jgi:hypothetical protein